MTLPEPWSFRIDPENRGLAERWFSRSIDDSQWDKIRTDKNVGWDKQGFADKAVGHGWYRTKLPLTREDLGRNFKYLHFGAVDEDAWLYLNGEKLSDHTVDSTGVLPAEIWQKSFSVSLSEVELRGDDLLAVRVYNRGAMGGASGSQCTCYSAIRH